MFDDLGRHPWSAGFSNFPEALKQPSHFRSVDIARQHDVPGTRLLLLSPYSSQAVTGPETTLANGATDYGICNQLPYRPFSTPGAL